MGMGGKRVYVTVPIVGPRGQLAKSPSDDSCSQLRAARRVFVDMGERQKKSRATNVPGKFIREASRLGDVGPFSGPWVSRTGRPAKTENSVREKTLYRGAVFAAAVREER